MKMEDGELNSFIEGLSNTNQSGQLVLTQQLQQQNPQTHFVVSPYSTNTYLSSSESPFPTPSPSPSIILRSPAPVKSPITNLQNIKSPIPVKSPGFQNVKSPSQNFQNVKSPTANFQNVKSPSIYQVKSPGVASIKSPASGVVKSPANIRSPGVCNPQSPVQAPSPFQHQVVGSPSNNRSPAPPPPTPSPTAPSPARPNTPQPVVNQFPPNHGNAIQHAQFSQTGQIVGGRTQMVCGAPQTQLQKTKQPLQILPKPLSATATAQKQTVPRLNATSIPQQTPLLINQSQNASPALVLNQVLTSGAPVLVQPAGPGGTVHLMLRPPTPTLQSGPGPPQNKMIITNSTQPQAQATVLIPNRQQVMRIMTAQGPMQLQQIQTPSGPQFIAIPQNQALSFPANSVLVQSSPSNAIQVQPNGSNPLQLQTNSANSIQLQQNPSGVLQTGTFPPNSLPVTTNQLALQNQLLHSNLIHKRDEKSISTETIGISDQKKIVIDNKMSSSKKNVASVNSVSAIGNAGVNFKKGKNGKKEEETGKSKAELSATTASTQQKNITSSLRQIRPGAFANRKQNQNNEMKEKTEDTTRNNLTRIIDSVASNTEHLISSPPKIDNLTATINSVAENIKSPTPDEIMSNLSFSDVFVSGTKTISLNKRPNLTIVQKQNKSAPPEVEEPNLTINRLILSPNSHSAVDFGNIPDANYDLELSGVVALQSTQPAFLADQNTSSSGFSAQEDSRKGKKKSNSKKKGKKEENRVDLLDLMKSAGIGDDEFDEPNELSFQPESTKMEGLEISSADTELLAQLQSAAQLPNNIRVIVGEDGRPVFFNGSNVLVPDAVHTGAAGCAAEPSEADPVLQNMILPDNVFNFTPQALATAQTQLNQLIQDHGSIAASSADQHLLSQIFGSASSSIGNSNVTTSNSMSNGNNSTSVMPVTTGTAPIAGPGPTPSAATTLLTTAQSNRVPMTNSAAKESMMVSVSSSSSSNCSNREVSHPTIVQKQPETKSEYIGGPPPGLPPLGPDSLVITNNNGVPTLVASPALMQYLQTHQGIIQFQHDPVTKTIQPSLIIPHPQAKIEVSTPATEARNDKNVNVSTTMRAVAQSKEMAMNKSRVEQKSSVGTVTEDLKNSYSAVPQNPTMPGVVKVNMVKFVKDNPSLLQLATETNNLITYRENNKNLTEKERSEVDRKIQQNRAILDQCLAMEHTRTGPPNVIVKESSNKEGVVYQVGNLEKSTDAMDDLKPLDGIKSVQATPVMAAAAVVNSPNPNSDFQTKFLESIGMANKVPTKSSIGTVTTPAPVVQTSPAKRGRKKKADKIQNQATQVEGKMEMTFNIAQLTPEQNLKLNQALQSRGVTASQVHNFDAIKQIIQEEIRKITAGTLQNTSIRFVSAPSFQQPPPLQEDCSDGSEHGVVYNVDHPNPGNVISLPGNDVVAINNSNQRIFQNQILSSGHIVASNNQILAIGSNHNQLVSLGNPINSSNQIVTLGNPPNVMSVNGNTTSGSVIVGSNGNVVAIVQTPVSGQGSGIVQRLQTIQLTPPKQQQLKTIQTQIQTLTLKSDRTPTEQATLQKLILEQQKILSSGRLVSSVPGSLPQGMQIVSQPVSQPNRFPSQSSQQVQTQTSQTVQTQQTGQVQPMYITTSANTKCVQPCKTSFTTQTAVSCKTSTTDANVPGHGNLPKLTVPPTVMISDGPTPNYGPLYVSPNNSGKNVTKCEKGTSPIQIQMGTQTVSNIEYRSGKMSTGTMTSPNTGKPQAVVAPAIVIQQTEAQSPTWQVKARNQQQTSTSPLRNQVPALSRTAFIEQQMRTDQAGATMPDTRTPFLSKSDACKRLLRYHVMDEKALSLRDLATADDMFEATAQHLLDKFRVMKDKYKYLLMLESTREVSTAERIMVDRNFIIEERIELEELREKEKRLQEEFENPTIYYSATGEATIMKTESAFDGVKSKREGSELFSGDRKSEEIDEPDENKSVSVEHSGKNASFKLNESNRNFEFYQMKSESKECKNTGTDRRRSLSSMEAAEDEEEEEEEEEEEDDDDDDDDDDGDDDDDDDEDDDEYEEEEEEPDPEYEEEELEFSHISTKCKVKNNRTFSDGSSKSSLDSSKDEDSGTDINAQVQSAIDSILNLQKCEELTNSTEDCGNAVKKKKKRKHGDRTSDSSKRMRGSKECDGKKHSSGESDYEDGCGSDGDPLLDEAIRSIMTS